MIGRESRPTYNVVRSSCCYTMHTFRHSHFVWCPPLNMFRFNRHVVSPLLNIITATQLCRYTRIVSTTSSKSVPIPSLTLPDFSIWNSFSSPWSLKCRNTFRFGLLSRVFLRLAIGFGDFEEKHARYLFPSASRSALHHTAIASNDACSVSTGEALTGSSSSLGRTTIVWTGVRMVEVQRTDLPRLEKQSPTEPRYSATSSRMRRFAGWARAS